LSKADCGRLTGRSQAHSEVDKRKVKMSATTHSAGIGSISSPGIYQKLNTVWHRRALHVFTFIVLAHWAEHLTQAYQIYVMGWARPRAGGFLGLFFPWLVSSEVLHYGYAIVMLVGLWVFRKGFTGSSQKWWTLALVIQFWHHIEHAVLQWQAISGHYWFGSPVPVSFLQTALPKFRVEIHLFYNAVVFIPMVIAMYYHMFPPKGEEHAECSCSLRHETMPAVAA
jgi:hypothetical protein